MLALLIVTTVHVLFSQLGGNPSVSFTLQLFLIALPASFSSSCSCTSMCYFVVNLKKGFSYQKVGVCTCARIRLSIWANPCLPFIGHRCAQISIVGAGNFAWAFRKAPRRTDVQQPLHQSCPSVLLKPCGCEARAWISSRPSFGLWDGSKSPWVNWKHCYYFRETVSQLHYWSLKLWSARFVKNSA